MMGAERNPGKTRRRSIDEVKIYRRVRIKISYVAAITLAAVSLIIGLSASQSWDRDRAPIRVVQDPYSVFTNIAVDPENDEVLVSDENRFNLLVYHRAINQSGIAEPLRRLGGGKTKIEFVCGVALDPVNREMYTVNNDTMDNMLVFSYQQQGDVEPLRELKVDHGAWGVGLDLDNGEVAITIQHINKVAIYRRGAQGEEAPLRIMQGPKTGLADPHGVSIDPDHNEIFVANQGSWHEELADAGPRVVEDRATTRGLNSRPLPPSTGRYFPPSITVYSRTANGDVAPLRTIQGPRTRLNLPAGLYLDPERDEIAVANDGGDSLLIFSRLAEGNAEPLRVIKGPATGLKNPTGVYVDIKHDEIWASNWGNHTATVYSRTAQGNTAPLRTIRSAPANAPLPGIGNPGSVTYDPVREQILVPN